MLDAESEKVVMGYLLVYIDDVLIVGQPESAGSHPGMLPVVCGQMMPNGSAMSWQLCDRENLFDFWEWSSFKRPLALNLAKRASCKSC